MAIEKVYNDPTGGTGGVSQEVFDTHAHNYRKITRIGSDSDDAWNSPKWTNVSGDGDFNSKEGGTADLEAVGITVATEPTSAPV